MDEGIVVSPKGDSSSNAANRQFHMNDMDKLELGRAMGIKDPLNPMYERKIEFIIKHMSEDGKATKGDILKKIRSLETKLGTPRWGTGETWLSTVYSYLKAQSHLDEATKVRDSYLQ